MPIAHALRTLPAVARVIARRLRRGPRRPGWSFLYEASNEVLRASMLAFSRQPPERCRRSWEAIAVETPLVRRCRRVAVDAGGVAAEWLLPPGRGEAPGASGPVLVYFHGGAYRFGSPRTHRDLACRLAAAADCPALVVDYRLAPEHPYPAARTDALAAYRWLLAEGVAPARIVLTGDSAGGNLAAVTLLALRDGAGPLPAAAALMCPWVDLTEGAYPAGGEVHDWGEGWMLDDWARSYLAGADPRAPYASPAHADLAGLPPLLVQVGGAELLLDQVTAFAGRARAAGVEAELRVYPERTHDWPTLAFLIPELGEAIDEIGRFVRARAGAAKAA